MAVQRIVDNREVSTADLHEEEVESRFEATFGVLLVIGLQATLALVSLGARWTLIGLPRWVWLIPVAPEAALLLALSWSLPRHRLEQMGLRRTVALELVGVITAANAMRFDASRFAAVYGAPGRPRRPAIWFTHLADAGPPAGSWEWSFCSRSWREQ